MVVILVEAFVTLTTERLVLDTQKMVTTPPDKDLSGPQAIVRKVDTLKTAGVVNTAEAFP